MRIIYFISSCNEINYNEIRVISLGYENNEIRVISLGYENPPYNITILFQYSIYLIRNFFNG